VINIDRIFGTTDENNTVTFIDGDLVVLNNNDYQELEEYLLYEDSESESENSESEPENSESEPENSESEPEEPIVKSRGFLSLFY
jgi:U3 small nucleolar RNA-associated protein 14